MISPTEHTRQLLGIADRADAVDDHPTDILVITTERNARPDERVVVKPRERAGPDWWRVEQVKREGAWRTRGKEAVDSVTVEDGRR